MDYRRTGGDPSELTVFGDKLYFRATINNLYGYELFVFDKDTQEITLVEDNMPGSIESYPSHFAEYEGKLFFSARSPGVGHELHVLALGEDDSTPDGESSEANTDDGNPLDSSGDGESSAGGGAFGALWILILCFGGLRISRVWTRN